MLHILHITTHMGGGVGRAIDAMMCYEKQTHSDVEQTLMLLEKPLDKRFTNNCIAKGIDVVGKPPDKELPSFISRFDIVLISWWNHPLMQKFLAAFPEVPVRLIFWVHVNAGTYPVFPYEFADLADEVLVTSRFTLKNPAWTDNQRQKISPRLNLVYGMENLEESNIPYKRNYKKSSIFKIGYLGTINYTKLNPEFNLICRKTIERIPEAEFTMIGLEDQEVVESIEKSGLNKCVKWAGFVESPEKELLNFDVFAYPLNKFHFGSTENSLLEAMAAGLPIVVLNQSTEKTIIKNGETGLLADNIDMFVEKIKYLYDNPALCRIIGQNARKYIKLEYKSSDNMKRFHQALDKTMQRSKKIVNFNALFGKTPIEYFLYFCGETQKAQFIKLLTSNDDFEIKKIIKTIPQIFKAKTKSSVHHFSVTFPESTELKRLDEMLYAGH